MLQGEGFHEDRCGGVQEPIYGKRRTSLGVKLDEVILIGQNKPSSPARADLSRLNDLLGMVGHYLGVG